MEIGSLFFKLGFKNEGDNNAEKFQQTMVSMDEVALNLAASLEKIAFVLERIGMRIGAIDEPIGALVPKVVSEPTALVGPKQSAMVGYLDQVRVKIKDIGERAATDFPMFSGQISRVLPLLFNMKTALAAAAVGMVTLSSKAASYAVDLARFNTITGLSSQNLQALQASTAQSGFTVDELSNTIKSLQKTAIDVRLGQGNLKPWQLLGITPSMDPFVTFMQLQKVIGTISQAKFTYFAKEAGLSEDVIALLAEMREGPKARQRFLLNDDEIKALKEYSMTANVASTDFKNVMIKLGATLAPFGKAIMDLFRGISNIFGQIVISFGWIGEKLGITSEKLLLIGTLAAAAFAPFAAIIAGVVILIEDLIAYFNGEDSVLGRALENLKGLFSALKEYFYWGLIKPLEFMFESIGKNISKMVDLVPDVFGSFFGPSTGSPAPSAPIGGSGAQFAGNRNQINNVTNTINIDGAKNPLEVAKEVQKGISKSNTDGFIQQPIGGY